MSASGQKRSFYRVKQKGAEAIPRLSLFNPRAAQYLSAAIRSAGTTADFSAVFTPAFGALALASSVMEARVLGVSVLATAFLDEASACATVFLDEASACATAFFDVASACATALDWGFFAFATGRHRDHKARPASPR